MNTQNKIVLYSDKRGKVELRADIEKDTIWATQDQIGRLFETTKQNVGLHFKSIFKTEELKEDSVVKESFTTAADGKRYKVNFYNLDAIIAVGYRVNSKKATQFRIWATGILRDYLVNGYALNGRTLVRSEEKLEGLHEALALIESKKHKGRLKGKITLKVTKDLTG